ncbi:hypothetical protein H490_0103925 [Leucobacter sp. UCD-THU]|uniref:hypothetical protein n=1 Tax=Leucobacter sp. UCD-THU TaxID=1292023 RepID=UPI00036F8BC3|nr:hypothetical protein [Leucobacter sp. UCD-THU]EYT56032.1 hypothetical protein H490_0103925 [Leucobacter sp. UCD-THU]
MPEQAEPEDLLLTPAEIQSLSNRPLTAALATALARSATGAVRDHCGWRVAKTAEETFTLTARSRTLLAVPSLHLVEVITLTERGRPLIAGIDFDWDENGILERIRGTWSSKRRGITVHVRHGYEQCPEGIGQSIATAVARGTLTPVGNVVSETTLGASLSFGRGPGGTAAGIMFLPHELARLDAHRIASSR